MGSGMREAVRDNGAGKAGSGPSVLCADSASDQEIRAPIPETDGGGESAGTVKDLLED